MYIDREERDTWEGLTKNLRKENSENKKEEKQQREES